jgi:type I restriction enzyme S subunit
MDVNNGYKQTEVGVIPGDWDLASVSHIATIKTGPFGTLLKASEYSPSGVPLISVGEIRQGFIRISDSTPRVSPTVTKRLPQYLLKTGDIVFGRKGGVDRSAPIRQEQDGWFLGSDGIMIRADATHDYEYLTFQFLTQRVRSWLLENATGTTMPSLNQRVLGGVQIPVPPLMVEERAIVEVLSDADALIESLEQLLDKKRQIKQGVMQELLTGKKRLPGFCEVWTYKRLGDLGRWTGGMTPSMRNQGYWHNGTVPWISSGDVKSSWLHTTAFAVSADAVRDRATIVVPANSIIVVTRSGILRKYLPVAKNMTPMAINQDIKALIPEAGVLPDYLLHALIYAGDSILARCLKSGTTVESIEFAWLKAFEIPVPHLSEQLAISVALNDLHADIDALEMKFSKARQLKQGMAQELLTGRIRLVRPSAKVLSFPVKESASVASIPHNTQINEAVVIAVLSAKFGSETFPLGRFRRTKFSYLLHRHVEHEAAGFMKKAAGPYNPTTRYGGAEKIALQNRYVRVLSTGKSEGFVADENIAQAEGYFEKWYGAEALTWLEQFRYQKNDALELLTTVDMACEDLYRAGEAITVSAVKQIIHDSPEWKAKLNRAVFSDDNIATTIQSCGQLFPIEEE